jgi:hypothetical protein
MKNIFYILTLSAFIFTSCEDPELDPLQFNKIKKGSILALRGQSYDNLGEENYLGGVDTVSNKADASKESFEFEADFLAEDQSTLASVDVFAKFKSNGVRTKVATIPESVFVLTGNYKRGKINIPLTEILKVTGKKLSDIPASDFDNGIFSNFIIESDINLKDGSIVKASSVINSSLSESAQFYPAHTLNYWVKK